ADDLWEQLSPQQRQRFQQLLSSGKISGLLPPWKPWWVVASQGPPMVQLLEVKDTQDSEPQQQQGAKPDLEASSQPPNEETVVGDRNHQPPAWDSNSLPALPEVIRPLSDLASGPVSPLVRFQLPNVLYAYAYTLSLYNGEADDAQVLPEVCETLLDLSAVLGAQRVFSSTGEALQAALQAITDGQYPECPLGKAGVMEAVGQILRGKQSWFALAAFAHLVRLLGQGKRRVAPQDQPRIYKAKKKCEFLLSWAKEEEGQLPSLALEVQREYVAHVVEAKEVGAITQELEKMWGGKKNWTEANPPYKVCFTPTAASVKGTTHTHAHTHTSPLKSRVMLAHKVWELRSTSLKLAKFEDPCLKEEVFYFLGGGPERGRDRRGPGGEGGPGV
ncbi:Zinc finger HIT domain-containing protein 2, partial [Ophiophagus hannah]